VGPKYKQNPVRLSFGKTHSSGTGLSCCQEFMVLNPNWEKLESAAEFWDQEICATQMMGVFGHGRFCKKPTLCFYNVQ
jgi:hypothetical protein